LTTKPPAPTDEQLSALFWRNHRRVLGSLAAAVVLAGTGTAFLLAGHEEAAAGFALVGAINSHLAAWYFSRARLLTHLRFGQTGPQRNEGINR
jgi:hypothetical protein